MANTRELRRRIKSIKNTSQITKAMQMVAATKMRKAQNQALGGRPYSENLLNSLSRLLPRIKVESHPLLSGNDSKTIGIVMFSTDKGLVGALNTNLMRMVQTRYPETSLDIPRSARNDNVIFYTIGKKGRAFVVRTGKDLKADFENVDTVTFRQARQLSRLLMDSFKAAEVGQVSLVYPKFVSTLRQEPKMEKILPIDLRSVFFADAKSDLVDVGDHLKDSSPELDSRLRGNDKGKDFLIEPNADELLDELLTHFVEIKIYQALLESKASEHSARMIAMQNATDNAKELVSDLTLAYNQTRQANITTELLEITTAQVAMS